MHFAAVALAMVAAMVLAACGSSGSDTSSGSSAAKSADSGAGASTTKAADSSSSGSTEPIKVGAVSILSGPAKTLGLDTIRGTEFAIERINAAGGVDGRKLELVKADGQNDPKVAVQAIARLLRDDKVDVLLGPVNSVSALTALPLVAQAKVPMIVYNAGAEKLTSTGSPWIFRTATTISAGFNSMVEYSQEHKLASKYAVIGWDLAPGLSGIAGVKAGTKKYGGSVSSVQQLSLDTQDFSGAIAKARSSGADGVMIDAPMAFAGVLTKQIVASGWKVPLFGWGGFLAEDFGGFTGSASNGMVMTDTGHAGALTDRPEGQEFVTAFKARYGHEPTSNELIGADAANIVAAGIEKAGSTDGEQVQTAIHALKYAGIRFDYAWTAAGDIVEHPIVATRWEGGKLKYLETLDQGAASVTG